MAVGLGTLSECVVHLPFIFLFLVMMPFCQMIVTEFSSNHGGNGSLL